MDDEDRHTTAYRSSGSIQAKHGAATDRSISPTAEGRPAPEDGRLGDTHGRSGDGEKRHVGFDVEGEHSAGDLRRFSLRESSSTFLASLTSASELSSPLTSPFPSSDSLQSSQASKDAERFGSIDTSSSYHHESTSKRSAPPVVFESPADTAPSSTTSIPLQPAEVERVSSSDIHAATSAAMVPKDHIFDGALDREKSLSGSDANFHRSKHGSASNSHEALHLASRSDKKMSISPSRFPSRSEAPSSVEAFDKTPTESSEPYFPAPPTHNRGDATEESHSKTPLLQLSDIPAPKETDQLVKDSSSMGNKLINNYEVIRRLGSGAHGTVKLAVNITDGQKVAMKVLKRYPKKGRLGKQEKPEDKVKKEVAILKKARHPHVVSLSEVIDDSKFEKVYLILEYVERGEINWRRETNRDIAAFELNRIRREIAGNFDEAAESETLLCFNEFLLQRHMEAIRSSSLESMSHGHGISEAAHPFAFAGQNPPHGGTYPAGQEMYLNPVHPSSRPTSRPSSRPSSRPASDYDENASPMHTLRVPSRTSLRGSHQIADSDLSGSMYGSYIEDDIATQASEFERGHAFEMAEDSSEWTTEEEEYRYVPCLTLSEARDVFRDTVLGLEYLHFHGIVHRDIKPANLLWTHDYRVKISDFGVSYLGRPMQGDGNDAPDEPTISHADMSIELAKTVGTPAFYAPELCDPDLFDAQRNITRPHITGQIDVWALGVTLYAMIFGRLPFYDANEFSMYEKIARHEVFIPSRRLRGVEDDGKIPMNSNKREDHVLDYETVDDELRDLLKRLLIKDPSKRISIKEVKHHPWVLRGIADQANWVDVTDPSYKGSRRIEVSQEDVQDAIVPRGWVEGIKSTVRRFASVVRGRGDSRKRAESGATAPSASVGALSRTSGTERERHRQSIHGEETIFSALRASKESIDHPLSQSTVASPVHEMFPSEFVPPISYVQGPTEDSLLAALSRPSANDRTTSTAESIVTLKPNTFAEFAGQSTGSDDGRQFGRESAGSSSSSISRIIDGTKEATRRITGRVRSKDATRLTLDDSGLSRESSADNVSAAVDKHHVQPVVGVSPLLASGHLQQPRVLGGVGSREPTPAQSPEPLRDSLAESLQGSTVERGRTTHVRSRANTSEWNPKTSDVGQLLPESRPTQLRIPSAASSDDRNASASSEPLSPIASNPSGESVSMSSLTDLPIGSTRAGGDHHAANTLLTTGETITPAIMKKYHAQQQQALSKANTNETDDAEDAEDEGSDDEGIVMGGTSKKQQ